MKYLVLACDYDGTMARDGGVDEATIAALERVRGSGRKLILVTGREVPDLQRTLTRLDLFDIVVAENGALLYTPATREETVLAEAPPVRFVDELRRRGVSPLSQGKVIVATWRPHETSVLELIRDLGLELQVIFNKGAVMVLPSGVNKAFGLKAALEALKLSPHNTVGIGDAENDHAFLTLCECSAAVANALPAIQEQVDFVTEKDRGAGVADLVEELVESDLQGRESTLRRPRIPLGWAIEGEEVSMPPLSENLVITGASGSGKSSLAKSILESLGERGYQFCIIDPEGDYQGIENAVMVGDREHEPSIEEVLTLLGRPEQNVVVNLLSVALERRPEFFGQILDAFRRLYRSSGRPHRLILDEAHHLLPSSADAKVILTDHCQATILITVHPEHVASSVLASIDNLVAVGKNRVDTVGAFADAISEKMPEAPAGLEKEEAWFWRRSERRLVRFRMAVPRFEHRRHQRKYAEGTLGDDKCFYFTGPDGKMRLKAHNLMLFLQLAEGVDDETWLYHLRRSDYSRWVRECIKDESLADEVERIESLPDAAPDSSRAEVRRQIETRYTAPP